MIATVEQIYSCPTAVATFSKGTKIMHKKLISILVGLFSLVSFALAGSEDLESFRQMYATATLPTAGTNCIQTLTVGAVSAGTFRLEFAGKGATVTWVGVNATLVANIDAALEGLATIGTGGVTTTAGTIVNGANGTVTVTFTGNNAKKVVPVMTTDSTGLTGGTITAAITTPGVTADGRIYPKGTLVMAKDTGKWYRNEGTPPNPTWVIMSTP